jgi:hypothetical protein
MSSSSASFLEIVELEDGKVVLRRADGEGDSLVQIQFSEETRVFLAEAAVEVARAMIGTGVQMVSEMYDLYDAEEGGRQTGARILH